MTKPKTSNPMKQLADSLPAEVLEEIIAGAAMGDMSAFKSTLQSLSKALIERALESELNQHLGYQKHQEGVGTNRRNGNSNKTIDTENGSMMLSIPRDREGTFDPIIVQKHQRRLLGFDDKVIAMYARGMSVRDIQSHLEEIYGVEVSPETISNITDAVLDEVTSWQQRPLNHCYPVVYFDAIFVKVNEQKQIKNKAFYLAMGLNLEGKKEILGLWVAQTEGAKFWLHVLTELKNRGMQEMAIACVDGLVGFPEAIHATFPKAQVQQCIVHLIRQSMRYASWKDVKAITQELRAVYTADTEEQALQALDTFAANWEAKYPSIPQLWLSRWEYISTFLAYPKDIRKVIYTTNAIEAVNRQIRKVIKTKGVFPNDTAACKLIFLALQHAEKTWTMPIKDWKPALAQFHIRFGDIMPL